MGDKHGMGEYVQVRMHDSVRLESTGKGLLESLRRKKVPLSFLYQGPRSAALWERLHICHAPCTHSAPYDALFETLLQELPDNGFQWVSLGCGLAEKDARMMTLAKGRVRAVELIDGSAELVSEATRRLAAEPSLLGDVRATVADIFQISDWDVSIALSQSVPRVFALFGIVPGSAPEEIGTLLSDAARPGDWIVADANLRPIDRSETGVVPGPIVAQYDNPECHDWLMASLGELGIYDSLGTLVFSSDRIQGPATTARIRADFVFDRAAEIVLTGESFPFAKGEKLAVFSSLRYQPDEFPNFLSGLGFEVVAAMFSASGEDGLYLFRCIGGASEGGETLGLD